MAVNFVQRNILQVSACGDPGPESGSTFSHLVYVHILRMQFPCRVLIASK
jgi:hypothetical protein